MNNKKFIIIFAILIVIIVSMIVYSLVFTIKKDNEQKKINITIEEFNNIKLKSENFKTSKVNDITNDNIPEIFGIEKDSINKFYGKISILNTDASLYFLVEPKSEKEDEVYSKLQEFCSSYEQSWSGYLESQYDMVVDRKIGKMNNYIYLVISDDSYDIIKNVEMK